MKQQSLFDEEAATVARDGAIHLVEQGATESDWENCMAAVLECARARASFTTDDVWQLLFDEGVSLSEPRVLGAVMKAAQRNKWCEPTKEFSLSRRTACHRRPLRVWNSRLV